MTNLSKEGWPDYPKIKVVITYDPRTRRYGSFSGTNHPILGKVTYGTDNGIGFGVNEGMELNNAMVSLKCKVDSMLKAMEYPKQIVVDLTPPPTPPPKKPVKRPGFFARLFGAR